MQQFTSPLGTTGLPDRHTYNGKETFAQHGYFEYGARWYDLVIGRWGVVDPLAEKYYSLSPYNYVGSNPAKNTDPTGMSCKGCGKDGEDMTPREINGNYAYIGDCRDCPKNKEFDIYRDSKNQFSYDKEAGIVYNGTGSASVTAKRWTREDEVAYQFSRSFQYNPRDDRDYGPWMPHGFGLQGSLSLGGAGMNLSIYGGLYFDDYGVTPYGGYEFSMGNGPLIPGASLGGSMYLSEYYNTYNGNISSFYDYAKTNGVYLGPLSATVSQSGEFDSSGALQASDRGVRLYGLGFDMGNKSFGKGPIPIGGIFTSGSNNAIYKTFNYRKRPTK